MTDRSDRDVLLPDLHDARARFERLVREIRPELHRYCARMTGSVVDGEDIVQDTLARAYFALGELDSIPSLRPWLFRIAHHRAVDLHRRSNRWRSEPLDELTAEGSPEDAVAAADARRTSFALFMGLPPSQRSAVILKDVLGQSVSEIGELLGLSASAIESCLHRGRARLRALGPAPDPAREPLSPVLLRYAELFGSRDWDGLRALLAEDVKLDLVAHSQRLGKAQVGRYFTNYDSISGWRAAPGWLEGRPVVALFAHGNDEAPAYLVELAIEAGFVTAIRDYRFVPYLLAEATIELASPWAGSSSTPAGSPRL